MLKYISIFFIGFFASICAVFVPRMLAMLNSSGGALQYFPRDYILVGLAFALVIGGITIIFEQGKHKSAAEIFMTALGIPALLAGALNTGATGNNLNELQAINQKLNSTLAQKSDITVDDNSTTITPLEPIPNKTPSTSSKMDFSFISTALARENEVVSENKTGINLGIQADQTSYLVVIQKFSSKDEAIQKAAELRKTVPSATAVQSNHSFLVIDGEGTLSKSAALLKAIELKNKTGLSPYLLQAK
jgi:hypothetical protein